MNGPSPYQLTILLALSRKSHVFQGVKKGQSLNERRAARRRHQRELVARRSATVRRAK